METTNEKIAFIRGILDYADWVFGINEYEKRYISIKIEGLKVSFKFNTGEKVYYGGDPTRLPEDKFYEDDYWFTLPTNYTNLDIIKGVEDFIDYLDTNVYFKEEVSCS